VLRRRGFLAGAIAIAIARPTSADDVAVPPAVQAQLLAKVAAYDKEYEKRAGGRAQIAIVHRPGNDESTRTAKAMLKELSALPAVGGLPHDESLLAWSSAKDLVAYIKKNRVAIVIFAPGLSGDVDAIRAALDSVPVLSVSTVADWVPRGIVLGFDLVSGKPKLLVHLGQAKKQNVAFKAEVLKLMRVYE